MTISNCQTSVTYSISGAGTFTPLSLTPNGILFGNELDLLENGAASLSSGPVAQFINATVTANFTMDPQWGIDIVVMRFLAQDDGVTVSENVNLNAPCVAFVAGDSSGTGSCRPPSPLQSGTISLNLTITSNAICSTCIFDKGDVGPGTLGLRQVPVPEPSTTVLMGLGIAAVLFSRRVCKVRLK